MMLVSVTFSLLKLKKLIKFKEETLFYSKLLMKKRNDFDGEVSSEAITTFINAHSIPTVMPFNDKAIEVVF